MLVTTDSWKLELSVIVSLDVDGYSYCHWYDAFAMRFCKGASVSAHEWPVCIPQFFRMCLFLFADMFIC